MSWTERRPFLSLALLALVLRAACSVLTEYRPLFPPYYYNDVKEIHAAALEDLEGARADRTKILTSPLAQRVQIAVTAAVYRACGPRPLAIKLVNAVLGALAVAVLAWTLSLVFPLRTALWSGLFVAVWPSHVFYTSQNLKEAPNGLLAYAGLGAALFAAFAPSLAPAGAAGWALAAALALFGAGCYRSYVLISLGAALLLTFAASARPRAARKNMLVAAAFVATTLAAYPAAARAVFVHLGSVGPGISVDPDISVDPNFEDFSLVPATHEPNATVTPTSPEGISRSRRWRQLSNRRWAETHEGREISTQIYPDAEFKTWGDVLLYLPKGSFTVLFMPLPGLYPMDGKIGRFAAAGENLMLLLIALLAAVGFARGPKEPARMGLLVFFVAMTAGAAVLEFDLGSAGRHKLLYLPMLFPFAVEEVLRLLGREESA